MFVKKNEPFLETKNEGDYLVLPPHVAPVMIQIFKLEIQEVGYNRLIYF